MWLSFGESEWGGADLDVVSGLAVSVEASSLDSGTLANGDADWSGRADGTSVPCNKGEHGTACGPGQQRAVS